MKRRAKVVFNNNLDQVTDSMKDSAPLVLEALARDTRARVTKKLLRGTRSGEIYQVPKTNKEYQASAPGEPPAPRTGQLANSYINRLVSPSSAIVASDVPQARLEYGFGNVAPRPHLRPAKDETMAEIDSIIRKVLGQQL